MDRRDLVKRFGAVAAAVALPSEAVARAADGIFEDAPLAGLRATWVSQYVYVAPDLAKTADWYQQMFGMQRGDATRREIHLWYGDRGGDTVMIVRQANAGETPGIDRVGFTLADWDRSAVQAELKRRGMQPISDTDRGFWFKDNEGSDIGVFAKDFMSRPTGGASSAPLWKALSVNHVQIIASDHKKMSAWYRDLLGLTQNWEGPTNAYPWVGDAVLAINLAREGRKSSAELGRMDHVAYTIANYNHAAAQVELEKRNLKPRDDFGMSWNMVDLNGLPTQVCDKALVPTAEKQLLNPKK